MQALFKLYKHEKIFLKILAIYNYITIIINEGGGNKKQTNKNKFKQFVKLFKNLILHVN